MATISAGQLRTYSIDSLMEDHLMASDHAVISVKGENKYVIITVDRYAELLSHLNVSLSLIDSATFTEDQPEKIIIETQPSLITKIRDKFFS